MPSEEPIPKEPTTPPSNTSEITADLATPIPPPLPASSSSDPHLLHSRWVIWFDNPRLAPPAINHNSDNWLDNLHKCGTFDSIESFWRIFNNIKPASQLSSHGNYHLFRDGVQPMWEDPCNVEGGKFVLSMPKKDSRTGRCDEWWLYTVLAVVGETMDAHGNQICGAVLSIRKSQDRIALWLKSAQDKDTCVQIGERWKQALLLNKTTLKFQSHKDGTCLYYLLEICGSYIEKCSVSYADEVVLCHFCDDADQ
jgi:translation initiation factor 4E